MLPFGFRQFSSSSAAPARINNITIIGAGIMGSGIAQISANAKLNVVLVDNSDETLNKAQNNIHRSLHRVAKKKFGDDKEPTETFISNVMNRIKTTTSVAKAVKEADLVIEAVVENLNVKLKLFDDVEKNCKSTAILATNTLSLRLADIGKNLDRKDKFGGLHFFNPVPSMKLLEVVRHNETSDETFDTLIKFGEKVGKSTVPCKDTPGFIVNRLLIPYLFEAIRMAERGDASFKDIDLVMKLGAGHPMGPFQLADYVGLDTIKFIVEGWEKMFPDDPLFRSSELLNKLVSEGKLGIKSGEGFYKYPIK